MKGMELLRVPQGRSTAPMGQQSHKIRESQNILVGFCPKDHPSPPMNSFPISNHAIPCKSSLSTFPAGPQGRIELTPKLFLSSHGRKTLPASCTKPSLFHRDERQEKQDERQEKQDERQEKQDERQEKQDERQEKQDERQEKQDERQEKQDERQEKQDQNLLGAGSAW
ncbi:hypothetical protein TURU_041601 [Turdus rufiventris]|nr:hypothetical protein TURU_041601 [Turdus rufiventris]